MVNIFQEIAKLLSSGKKAVMARIVGQVGSAPRSLGTKFLVLEDESIVGTIGGGSMEHQVIEKAKDVFKQGQSTMLHLQLSGKEVARSEMLCGGLVDIFLEPLFPENKMATEVFQTAGRWVAEGRSGWFLTRIAEGSDYNHKNSHLLIDRHGTKAGGLGDMLTEKEDDLLDKWCSIAKPTLIEIVSKSSKSALFIEPVRPDDILYLFGAGHISTFVAPLAKMIGFRVVVIDDRRDFANATRFPSADNIVVCPFPAAFDQISINPSSYICIVTRGHIHDREVLRSALNSNAAYIGMIGSRRKRDMIYQALREEGINQKIIDDVHSPIGLDIGAETPEEIAVSIVAELIQIKANHAGTHEPKTRT